MGREFYIFRLEWDDYFDYFIYLDWNGTSILNIWIGMERVFYIFRLEWDEYFIFLDWNGTSIVYL